MRANQPTTLRPRGFTLLELITTMAVGVVLVGFAVPSMANFMRNHRALTVADSFSTAVTKARSIAAATNSYVTVAPMDGSNWSSGWRVFSEGATPNGTYENTEKLIGVYEKLPTDVIITDVSTPAGLNYISFSPVGYSQNADKAQMSMTAGFQIGTSRRVVEVSLLGRSRVCNPDVDTTTCAMP
ncbi:type IV fimbrial biogenesis protein FimT [Cupriavidus sp. YR651]|uniref:GspH/FimT family pseudopilin n=1 Tax=Cupriavidus sp. YR651 TaxID=1855315 RepID=UPI0008877953|nr:GspH/FimT family pseudopilin [Cupriavidus sp. YR651]SDC20469.1 type IV fimbrial biogenesis protein FimT [Cupriavidus sp. YR651]